MARRMIAPDEKITVRQVKVLLFGPPGVGKTTLAATSNLPVLFDFDTGVHRANYRPHAFMFDAWEDAIEQVTSARDELRPFKTVIIDTLGRCQDFIADYIIRTDYRNPKSGYFVNHNEHDGSLTLKGFGAMKGHFINFIRTLQMLGLDLVFLAHDKEESETKRTRPDIMGGAYAETMKVLDMCGYTSMRGNIRQLNFNPSGDFVGKNGASIPPMDIPEIPVNSTDFLANLIVQMKDQMGTVADEHLEALELLEMYRTAIEASKRADDINSIIDSIKVEKQIISSQLRPALSARVKQLPIWLDKESGLYFDQGHTANATLANVGAETQTEGTGEQEPPKEPTKPVEPAAPKDATTQRKALPGSKKTEPKPEQQ